MKITVNEAANRMFEELLDDSKGDFFNTKFKFSKILDEFELGIRQDQKEKCIKAVLNIVPGEEPIEQETIIHSIMDAD